MLASNVTPGEGHDQSKNELVITRIFDAPRELVFKLWTDPEHVAQWWGPHRFKTTVQEMNVRVGGRWRYAMRGPDGNDHPFDGVYLAVAEPERLVFEGSIHGDSSQSVWTEVTFTEQAGKTKVTVHQVFSFESAATRGASMGWNQQLDRLTAYLARR
jgi:uncharacterized protein YndB with AHSA1/START domain